MNVHSSRSHAIFRMVHKFESLPYIKRPFIELRRSPSGSQYSIVGSESIITASSSFSLVIYFQCSEINDICYKHSLGHSHNLRMDIFVNLIIFYF